MQHPSKSVKMLSTNQIEYNQDYMYEFQNKKLNCSSLIMNNTRKSGITISTRVVYPFFIDTPFSNHIVASQLSQLEVCIF